MLKKEVISFSPAETKKIAANLARTVLNFQQKNRAAAFCLNGNLGSGKTAFAQGFAAGLKIKDEILSPTYVIFRRYPLNKGGFFKNFYHFDCYRLEEEQELFALGFEKLIADPRNIILIEWASKLESPLLEQAPEIIFGALGESKRKIKFRGVFPPGFKPK